MTDTQPRRMVGSYGEHGFETPRLDRLAAEGLRFDRAYCSSPLCTPARCALFSGCHPIVGGAWANEMTPARGVPLLAEVLRRAGIRAGYTGKWHLDGSGYHGGGKADGGFEPGWWYDGSNYRQEVGEARFRQLVDAIKGSVSPTRGVTPELGKAMRAHDAEAALNAIGARDGEMWGHRVADRAVDFLERVGPDRFVLVVSFDEPHGPFVVPPAYASRYRVTDFAPPPNYAAPLDGKPALQRQQAREFPVGNWEDYCAWRLRHFRCNAWIDTQIGRVIDAVDRNHAEDTTIIYTSDHGDMMGAHGLLSKGPMMYEESVGVPLIIRSPGCAAAVHTRPVSHLDLMPTILDLVGVAAPQVQHGTSLARLLRDPAARHRDLAHISYNRFAIDGSAHGEFFPIRCVVTERYKLAINLFDSDELYDLHDDPQERHNRIGDESLCSVRAELHGAILSEMERTCDPLRNPVWTQRDWSHGRDWRFYPHLPDRSAGQESAEAR